MTEDEAKTKWCPFARLIPAKRMPDGAVQHNGDAPTFNRYNTDEKGVSALPSGGFCIGSACMAWRWQEEYPGQANDTFAKRSTTEGYCGLAGKP